MAEYTLDFCQIGMKDISRGGGKNASLGEMFNALKQNGVGVLDGFATTVEAFRLLLRSSGLAEKLRALFADLDVDNVEQLAARGHAARTAVLETPLPAEIREAILDAHARLCFRLDREVEMAV
jgi:pyruvate, water dikinase